MLKLEDSATYRWLVRTAEAKGIAKGEATGLLTEARTTVLEMGEGRFGTPAPAVRSKIEAEANLETLRRWRRRLLSVDGWEALLAD